MFGNFSNTHKVFVKIKKSDTIIINYKVIDTK